jgi:tRNA U38,U39,U40 pseudouridine synthase TruA
MRTTLTLDEDVAKRLEQLQRERRTSFKALVNEALREGIRVLEQPPPPTTFKTRTVSLGRLYLGSLDNIGEVLATTEEEAFR